MTSILLVTPDLQDNSTGRTYVWWALARHLGWSVRVVSFQGKDMWGPLRGSDFAADSTLLRERYPWTKARRINKLARTHDAVIAVKPLSNSLGVTINALAFGPFPLIVDIDDPDLEVRLRKGNALRRVLWRIRHFPLWLRVRDFRWVSDRAAIAVSNPVLQGRYGGTIVPHARRDPGPGRKHESESPSVAFIGTIRAHKGIDVLRDAVADLAPEGVRLVITGTPPEDAQPWEQWVGEGSMEEGERLLDQSDIVALPSLATPFASGQLPAKLVDAMIRGRIPVVSNIEPMPWAVDNASLTVHPGSTEALASAIHRLTDPALRQVLSEQIRQRALAMFSIESVAHTLPQLLAESKRKMSRRGD